MKKRIFILLILTLFLTISTAYAEENNLTGNGTNILKVQEVSSTGSFQDLKNLIDNSYGTVNLNRDYKYNPSTDYKLETNDIYITRDVTINGNNHVIEKNLNYNPFIFDIAEGKTVTISNLNFKYTDNYKANGDTKIGEMIYNAGTLTIRNCNFVGQSDTEFTWVDAIHNTNRLNIVNCDFRNFYEVVTSEGTLYLSDSYFSGNCAEAIGNMGYANIRSSRFMYNTNCLFSTITNEGTCYIIDSIFNGNSNTNYGGVIHNYEHGTLEVTNSVFQNNYADINGGAIYNEGKVTVTNSRFTSNNAKAFGSGIYNYEGSLKITNSNFTNSNGDADVIHLSDSYNYKTTIDNCIISNNHNAFAISNLGGYLILNNSVISNNDGGIFARSRAYDAVNIIDNSIISGNTEQGIFNGYPQGSTVTNLTHSVLINNGIGIENSYVSPYYDYEDNIVNAHYNVIYNTVNIINDDENTNKAYVNAQYNWWGVNSGDSKSEGRNIRTGNNIVLTVSPQSSTNKQTWINIDLAHDNRNNLLSDSIPKRNITYTITGSGSINDYNKELKTSKNVLYTNNESGKLKIKVDNQEFTVNVAINKTTSPVINTTNTTTPIVNTTNNTNNTAPVVNNTNKNSILEITSLTKELGTSTPFTGKLLDDDGNPILGHHISLKLTRLSNGQSKTYDVVSDYSGEFVLPINLGVGVYGVEVVYDGLVLDGKTYSPVSYNTTITVVNELSNKTVSILSVDSFNEPYGAGKSLTGHLVSGTGANIIGHHVSVTLTRVSSGASKTYDVVVDYTGVFALDINLAPGVYSVSCSYEGTEEYQKSTASNTLTVY